MKPTPMQIIAACDAGSDAMVALGLPCPTTYLDRIKTMWAAHDELTYNDERRLYRRDHRELMRVRSACPKRGTGAYPVHLKGGVVPYHQDAQ